MSFKRVLPVYFLFLFTIAGAQDKVSFFAEDSLRLTADLYLKNHTSPFILLFHQGSSSRGEYADIAKKLTKLDYNCLAVDLRSGEKINFVANESARNAKTGKFNNSLISSGKDIQAALRFIRKYNDKQPILMGSSFSASLCLMEANSNPDIKAVVALSPGEYFRPDVVVKERVNSISVPVFISSTAMEYKYISEMISSLPKNLVRIYQSAEDEGAHGAKMLWQSTASSNECWLELLLFFKNLQY